MLLRAGARGRGAIRPSRGACAIGGRRLTQDSPRSRRVRRHAVRRTMRTDRRVGTEPVAFRGAGDGARISGPASPFARRCVGTAAGAPRSPGSGAHPQLSWRLDMTGGSSGSAVGATHVLVVGAGVAGTAAACTAARAGVPVLVLDGGSGASTLATGALDWVFWQ